MKPFFLILFGFISCTLPVTAELSSDRYWSSDELLARMLKVHPFLNMQNQEQLVDQERRKLEQRWPNPSLSAALGRGRPFSTDDGGRQLWGLGIDIVLPNPLARYYTLQGLDWETKAADSRRLSERWRLIHDFRLCIYDLQRLQAQLKIQAGLLADLETTLRIVEAWVSVGESRSDEALRARSELMMARAQHSDLMAALAARRQELHAHLGAELAVDIRIADEQTVSESFLDTAELENRLLEGPDLAEQRAVLAMQGSLLRSARNGWFPDLVVHFERGREMDADIWKGAVSVEIPLFSSRMSRLPLLRYELARAQLAVQNREGLVLAEMRRYLGDITSLRQLLEAFDEGELRAGEEELRLAAVAMKSGEISLYAYLETRRSWFEAQMKRPEVLARYRAALSAIETLIGGF